MNTKIMKKTWNSARDPSPRATPRRHTRSLHGAIPPAREDPPRVSPDTTYHSGYIGMLHRLVLRRRNMRKIGDCAIHLTPLSESSVEDCQGDELAEGKDAGSTFVLHLGMACMEFIYVMHG